MPPLSECVDALGDAAAAGEERVREAGQRERTGAAGLRRAAHAGFAGPGWKPGGAGTARLATTIALNSAPISFSPLPTRRRRAASNSSARSGARSASARARTIDAERAQEVALVDRAVDGGAGGARAARHRGEVHMRGEVAFARVGQRVDRAMGAHRLQRVAEAGGGVAVVEEQRRAALFDQPRAEFEHEAVRDGADLDHRAFVGLRR